jgi:DegV family protein with EDD domain
MKKVAIVTDTTACIPLEQVGRYNIEVVPVQLNFEDRSYRDGMDITPNEFYAMLREAKKMPTTSSSSPAPYLEAYRNASQKAKRILCFTEPAKFSAMFNAANVAREISRNVLPGIIIEIIECTTAAAGQGLVALAAARVAEQEKTMEEVMATVHEIMPRISLYATLDTLRYLVKSGRVPQAAALLNSVLNIKPVFTLNHANARTVALPRSTKSAMNRILKLMEKDAGEKPLHVAVMHADALDNATELHNRIRDRFECEELFITEFTPVMGVHTGPGLLGVAFYSQETPS